MLQQICDKTIRLREGAIVKPSGLEIGTFFKSLGKNSEFICQATSGSMHPEIKKGDSLVVKKIPFNDIKIGDVAAFSFDNVGEIIIHRIVSSSGKKRGYLTKGDRSYRHDPWILTKNQYLGKVVEVRKKS